MDTQIVEEAFVEDINNILSSGEVSNLYKSDEFEEVSWLLCWLTTGRRTKWTAWTVLTLHTWIKGKVLPYLLLSIVPGTDPRVQAVSPWATLSLPPGGRMPSLRQACTFKFSLSLIYQLRRDEMLSWFGLLTCSRWFTRYSGHPSAASRAWDRKSSPAKDRRSTTVQCNSYLYIILELAFLLRARWSGTYCKIIYVIHCLVKTLLGDH